MFARWCLQTFPEGYAIFALKRAASRKHQNKRSQVSSVRPASLLAARVPFLTEHNISCRKYFLVGSKTSTFDEHTGMSVIAFNHSITTLEKMLNCLNCASTNPLSDLDPLVYSSSLLALLQLSPLFRRYK